MIAGGDGVFRIKESYKGTSCSSLDPEHRDWEKNVEKCRTEKDLIIDRIKNIAQTFECRTGYWFDWCRDNEYREAVSRLGALEIAERVVSSNRCGEILEVLRQSSIKKQGEWFGDSDFVTVNDRTRQSLLIYCTAAWPSEQCASIVETVAASVRLRVEEGLLEALGGATPSATPAQTAEGEKTPARRKSQPARSLTAPAPARRPAATLPESTPEEVGRPVAPVPTAAPAAAPQKAPKITELPEGHF